ncbi:PP2C family protein-serine/threonine phosphatase [Geothrix sp. PMB-07]|uniref:PP2C family protein-serine/threonine phosphatase n=1 Tax=Geothrix sp. PMB-07 TaxID=3068640 RepID=UPI0027407889|nr:SpoIIE family protein phosphatase [Geothrix sp. PMB-07]WLT30549.1 SpoIIE family protein phosphatase [Geothrix sp. PMB-07]
MRDLLDPIRRGWAAFRFRRHWPWLLLAVGLLLGLPPTENGCAQALGWLGGLVLFFRGLRWIWVKLLFRVSRRLWVILALMSVLPMLAMVVMLMALGWLGLGAQVSRSTQQTLVAWEEALKTANREPSDAAALQALRTYGGAWIERTRALPEGVPETFVGMVWADSRDAGSDADPQGTRKDTYLRAVRKEPGGYRILSLNLGVLGDRAQAMAGGEVSFTLVSRKLRRDGEDTITFKAGGREASKPAPILVGEGGNVASWTKGQALHGSGLFAPFHLPPLAFTITDWSSGEALVLTATPETNLYALFAGFRSGEKQSLSADTVKAIVVVSLVLVALASAQALAAVLGLVLAWSLGRAVNDLHGGVNRLSLGDFSTRIRLRGRDQVAQLSAAFNDMAARLQTAASEREERLRMEEELRVAREVQMRLLPDLEALRMPSVRATILPAREVAGDYYDLFPLLDGSLAFLILDVSGKGTSAAFYAAETKGVLSALDKQALGPVDVADRLNAIWCQGHDRRLFLTLAYGTFHPHSGRYQFVRAGHPSAFLRHGDGRVSRLHPRGLGVGLSANRFREALELHEGILEPGGSLIFYTDGLSEAQAPDDSFYGEDRLEALLARPTEDLQNAILADVATFAQGRPLADDLTLLILSRGSA